MSPPSGSSPWPHASSCHSASAFAAISRLTRPAASDRLRLSSFLADTISTGVPVRSGKQFSAKGICGRSKMAPAAGAGCLAISAAAVIAPLEKPISSAGCPCLCATSNSRRDSSSVRALRFSSSMEPSLRLLKKVKEGPEGSRPRGIYWGRRDATSLAKSASESSLLLLPCRNTSGWSGLPTLR